MDDKSAPSATLGAEDNDNDSSNNGNSSSSSDDDVVSLKSKDSMVSGIIINHDDEEEDYEGAGAPPPKAKKAKAKDKAPKKAPKAAAQPKAKKAKPANNQSKGTFWFGTWNNPPGPASNTKPEDLRWPEPLPQEVSGVHYSVERGENGTVHFQFVIKMARQTRFAAVHKLYPECYLEVVTPEKGGVDGALKYCEKEDTHIAGPFTVGEPVTKRQGKRTDLDEVKKAIKEGFSDGQLYDHFFNSMARYPHLAHHARMAWASKALRDVEVNVYYGVAGGGKSHAAYHDMPDAYRKPDAGQWWDGYQGEKDIIIDDFAGNMACQDFLKVTDKYPLKVQVKGGYVPACWTRIIITTNIHPKDWWKEHFAKVPEHMKAVKRRLNTVLKFKKAFAELSNEQQEQLKNAKDKKEEYDLMVDFDMIEDITEESWDDVFNASSSAV